MKLKKSLRGWANIGVDISDTILKDLTKLLNIFKCFIPTHLDMGCATVTVIGFNQTV